MLIEQIVEFQLKGPGPPGRTCNPITGRSVAEWVKASFLRRLWSQDHEFNPHPGHVVASLDKTPYDNYLCLVASNKQQIYVGRSQNVNRKAWKMVNS